VRADGTITAWEFHNYNSGSAGIRSYYEIPNQRIVFHENAVAVTPGNRTEHWRRTSESFLRRESHMDGIGARGGKWMGSNSGSRI